MPDPAVPSWRETFRRAGLLILAGLPGIAVLPLVIVAPPGVPVAALLLQPLVLLVAFAWVGARLAPRAGFRSHLADGALWGIAAAPLLRAAAWGFAAGLIVATIDQIAAPLWRPAGLPTLLEGWSWSALSAGVLYGGVTEEIVMRWGLLSLVVWGVWHLAARQRASAPAGMIWFAIVLSALFFAAGHVPALAALTPEPGVGLVARTMLLNGALGILFGWLYARRALEHAIAAHAAFHVGVTATALAARASGWV